MIRASLLPKCGLIALSAKTPAIPVRSLRCKREAARHAMANPVSLWVLIATSPVAIGFTGAAPSQRVGVICVVLYHQSPTNLRLTECCRVNIRHHLEPAPPCLSRCLRNVLVFCHLDSPRTDNCLGGKLSVGTRRRDSIVVWPGSAFAKALLKERRQMRGRYSQLCREYYCGRHQTCRCHCRWWQRVLASKSG